MLQMSSFSFMNQLDVTLKILSLEMTLFTHVPEFSVIYQSVSEEVGCESHVYKKSNCVAGNKATSKPLFCPLNLCTFIAGST